MALRLLSVSRSYGAQKALDAVSLHVRPGDCYGFLGHNGAGKTTAMRIALGLLRPHSGTVLVEGFDASLHAREARARMGGLIETPGFLPSLDGISNLVLLARLQGLRGAAADKEAERVLGEVGLAHTGRKPVGAFSQGMRQRLGIAQALLGRPRIILLDEPTNGLDPEGIEEMRRLLRHLTSDEGATVLISSHQLHELEGLCNRVGVLRKGRLLLEAETAQLLGGSRHALVAGEPVRAREVAASLGLAVEEAGDALVLDLGTHAPDAVLAELLAGGAQPQSFAPQARSLEDVYLSLGDGSPSVQSPHVNGERPTEVIAPGGATLRVVGYDVGRALRGVAVPLLLTIPALVGTLSVVSRYVQSRRDAAEMAEGTLTSATSVTAFEGVAHALRSGLPVMALVLAAIASQSIAGESAKGTLRNVLLRPVRRVQVAVGKAGAVLLAGAMSYALLLAAAFLVSAAAFDFGDVTEILFNGEPFPLVLAEDLWPPLRRALAAPLPGIAASALLGFAAGSLVRGAAAALGTALGGLLLLDGSRVVLQGLGAGEWVPTAYFPTPLRDTSVVRQFMDLAQGISNPAPFADAYVLVPLVWAVAAFAVAAFALSRRSVR